MVELWIVGAIVGAIGSIASNLGVNIQKYAFMQDEKKGIKRPFVCMPGWWLGIVAVITGAIFDFVALGFAAQSIVAPIGAVTLVANVIFASCWLGEKFSKWDFLGTTMILVGSTLAVCFGDHSQNTYTTQELLDFYSQLGFILYAIACVFFIMALYVVVRFAEPLKDEIRRVNKQYDAADDAHNDAEADRLDEDLNTLEARYQKFVKIHPFAYCAISGVFGGQNILFGKMVAELVKKTVLGDTQMKNPFTYLFMVCMFVSIYLQLRFMAKALEYFDALYVVPVFQCFFISVSTLAGAAYFGEFDNFSVSNWIAFPIGITMTMAGVYVLSARNMRTTGRSRARGTHTVVRLSATGEVFQPNRLSTHHARATATVHPEITQVSNQALAKTQRLHSTPVSETNGDVALDVNAGQPGERRRKRPKKKKPKSDDSAEPSTPPLGPHTDPSKQPLAEPLTKIEEREREQPPQPPNKKVKGNTTPKAKKKKAQKKADAEDPKKLAEKTPETIEQASPIEQGRGGKMLAHFGSSSKKFTFPQDRIEETVIHKETDGKSSPGQCHTETHHGEEI